MPDFLLPYGNVVFAMGVVGLLLLVQILVADLAGIRARHPPGTPVAPDPRIFLFRAVRAHANTNESVAAFILLALFGMFTGAKPAWLNGLALTYAIARGGHMLCYYADWRLARSIAFAVALIALLLMLVVGAFT